MQRWLISMCFLSPCVRYSFAQSAFPRNISGIVTDSPETVVPRASIQATDIATGVIYKTVRRQR